MFLLWACGLYPAVAHKGLWRTRPLLTVNFINDLNSNQENRCKK